MKRSSSDWFLEISIQLALKIGSPEKHMKTGKVDQMTVIWSYDIDGYNISGCLCKFLSKFDVLFCAIIRFSNYV